MCVTVSQGFGVAEAAKSTHTEALQPQTTLAPTSTRPSFLHFGDSLTQQGGWSGGWIAKLQQTYSPGVAVLNRGRSGNNTNETLHVVVPSVLHELASLEPPVLITVWLGANDAALAKGPNAAQHTPIDQYKKNLRAILRRLRDFAPLARIVLITPPVVDDATRRHILIDDGKPGSPLDRSNSQAAAYAAACGEVARAVANTPERVTLLDLHSYLMATYPRARDRAALLRDGLHFSDRGNAVVLEQVKRQIEALLPESLLRA